jgi:CRP-like cAMP-binding protein
MGSVGGKTMEIDCAWLEKHFFKQHLNDKQKKLICSTFERVVYPKGKTIISQGEKSRTVYILFSGSAHIESEANGEKIDLGTVSAGQMVGEMSFISEATASATVTAKEDCVIFKLSRNTFSEMQKEDKGLVSLIFITLLRRTTQLIKQMNTERSSIQQYMSGSHC